MNGKQLKQARADLRLMQKDLAAIVGLTPERLSRMENDAVPVTDSVEMIVFLLGRDPGAVNDALTLARAPKGATERETA